jgi:hypothetical protein
VIVFIYLLHSWVTVRFMCMDCTWFYQYYVGYCFLRYIWYEGHFESWWLWLVILLTNLYLFLGTLTELEKVTLSFVMSVRLSIHPFIHIEYIDSHCMVFLEIIYLGCLVKCKENSTLVKIGQKQTCYMNIYLNLWSSTMTVLHNGGILCLCEVCADTQQSQTGCHGYLVLIEEI